jgi:ubiquinol-cytochrome c reductase iron-sulfur subunit
VAGAGAGIATAVPFVSTFAPSERAKAAGAAVEVDISDLQVGEKKTVEWRGQPVWIVRRSPEMVASLSKDKAELADPASWGAEGDKETCISRYYENIQSMNVFINFTNRLHARYGICYEAHRQ